MNYIRTGLLLLNTKSNTSEGKKLRKMITYGNDKDIKKDKEGKKKRNAGERDTGKSEIYLID